MKNNPSTPISVESGHNGQPAKEPPLSGSERRLVRSSRGRLEIEGIRCGIQQRWESEPCGGKLYVIDWHPKGVRGEGRYEITCEKCLTCDPNGWPRQSDLLENAAEYFSAIPDTANV